MNCKRHSGYIQTQLTGTCNNSLSPAAPAFLLIWCWAINESSSCICSLHQCDFDCSHTYSVTLNVPILSFSPYHCTSLLCPLRAILFYLKSKYWAHVETYALKLPLSMFLCLIHATAKALHTSLSYKKNLIWHEKQVKRITSQKTWIWHHQVFTQQESDIAFKLQDLYQTNLVSCFLKNWIINVMQI